MIVGDVRRGGTGRRAVTVLVAVAVLSGCSGGGTKVCTLVDMDSGVSVRWRPADFGAADAATLRLCVGEVCEERRSGGDDPSFVPGLSIPLPEADGPGPVRVRLSVTSAADGSRLVTDAVDATLEEQHPNGEGCEPTAWTAAFRATPTGLTAPEGLPLR
ncbi:hypothetical protein [Streptomyces sp. NPDC060194]|uniref:hypothetical protein n=1 Tax=Streptomyces sp. NPDC060194 TaxID=3347069 RepID=UPI003657E757